MTDILDLATEREEQHRADALADQARRNKLAGKSIHDSAHRCRVCDEPIPKARRRLVPGVQTCVDCQTHLEFRDQVSGIRYQRRGFDT